MANKNEIKQSLSTGQIITEAKLTEFIDAAHNEVSGVSTVEMGNGLYLSWLNSGNIYSLWTHGKLTEDTLLSDLNVSSSDVFPLSLYQGEPLYELTMVLNYDTNGEIDTILPGLLCEIGSQGMRFLDASGGAIGTVAEDMALSVTKVLVLGTPEEVE